MSDRVCVASGLSAVAQVPLIKARFAALGIPLFVSNEHVAALALTLDRTCDVWVAKADEAAARSALAELEGTADSESLAESNEADAAPTDDAMPTLTARHERRQAYAVALFCAVFGLGLNALREGRRGLFLILFAAIIFGYTRLSSDVTWVWLIVGANACDLGVSWQAARRRFAAHVPPALPRATVI